MKKTLQETTCGGWVWEKRGSWGNGVCGWDGWWVGKTINMEGKCKFLFLNECGGKLGSRGKGQMWVEWREGHLTIVMEEQ